MWEPRWTTTTATTMMTKRPGRDPAGPEGRGTASPEGEAGGCEDRRKGLRAYSLPKLCREASNPRERVRRARGHDCQVIGPGWRQEAAGRSAAGRAVPGRP